MTGQLPEYPGREPSAAELATAADPRLGIAYAVNVRNEGGGENSVAQVILSYRLHRRGPDGRPLPTLQVEMRGRRLQWMVAEGDLIQAPGPLPPTGVVQLESVANLTTGASVSLPRPRTSAVAIVLLVGFLVIFVIVFGAILIGFLGLTS